MMKYLMYTMVCFFMLLGTGGSKVQASDKFIGVMPVTFNKALSTAVTGTVTSDKIDLSQIRLEGFSSLKIYVEDAGSADVDVYYIISYNGINFYRPVDSDNVRVALIYDDFAEDDGYANDGVEIKPFSIVVAPYIKFVVNKGSQSADVDGVTLELCIQ